MFTVFQMATTFMKPTLGERIDQQRRFIDKVKAKLVSVEEEYAKKTDVGSHVWIECTKRLLMEEEENLQNLISQKISQQYRANVSKQYYEMLRKDAGVV